MSVSLVMIACNADKILGRALSSIRDYVDEIIIVDTGSDDNTKDVAASFGAVVLDFNSDTHPQHFILDTPGNWKKELPGPFTNVMRLCHFGAARQFGWDRASCDFIMWLDCDDVVEGAENIEGVVRDMKSKGIDSAMLNYDYDHDEAGNVTLRLFRERIVRKGIARWEQPVHEVLSPCGIVERYSSINISHRRSKDKLPPIWHHRNLKILLRWEESMSHGYDHADPRILFYLGMEERFLYPEDALRHFGIYVLRSGWDEERAMAHALCGKIHEGAGRFHDALREYSMASIEFKSNPDNLFNCARCAYYLRNWQKVIEWTNEARAIEAKLSASPSMLFEDPYERSWRPYVFLSVALFNTGQMTLCMSACEEGLKVMPTEPHLLANLDVARKNLDEANRAPKPGAKFDLSISMSEPLSAPPMDIPNEVLSAMAIQIWKRCETLEQKKAFAGSLPATIAAGKRISMIGTENSNEKAPSEVKDKLEPAPSPRRLKIAIWTGPAWETWRPESINEGGIGGSETAAIHMARELSKLGHDVSVFGVWNGNDDDVQYQDYREVTEFSGDVLVTSRHPQTVLDNRWKTKAKFVWAHDIHVGQSLEVNKALSESDGLFALSNWHATYMASLYPELPREKILVTRNGIDISRFAEEPHKTAPRLIYPSSPDRGLMRLLQLFPQIRSKVPNAELHVYYGFYNWKKMAEVTHNGDELARIASYEKILGETEGVINHGRVGQKELADAFLQSRVWAYPTWFSETSCITAMEAQAAGCVPVTSNLAALSETVRHGILISGSEDSEEYGKKFVSNVISLLSESPATEHISSSARKYAMDNLSWKGVAKEWEQIFLATVGRSKFETAEVDVKETVEDKAGKVEVCTVKRMPRLALMYGLFSSSIHGKFDIPSLWENSGLTGSESCFFNMTKALAEAGCEIDLFCDVTSHYQATKELSGAHVYPIGSTRPDSSYDAYLAWNEPDLLKDVPSNKLRICVQQLNDFSSYSSAGFDEWIDAYVMPSHTLASYLATTEKITRSKIEVIPNSINMEFYDKRYRRGKTIVWCSSPDRGLHVLLPIFERVRRRISDVTLRVFYRYDKWVEANIGQRSPSGDRARMIEEHLARVGRCGENGVIMFDSVSNKRMARELMSSRAFAYTCEPVRFTEGFSVSIMDACAAGCAAIISDADALPEIYQGAVHIIPGRPSEKMEQWTEDLCRIFEDENFAENLASRSRAFAAGFDKKIVVDKFLNLIQSRRKTKEQT